MGIAQRHRELDKWLAENKAFSPGRVYLLLGRRAIREGGYTESIGLEELNLSDTDQWTEGEIRDMAECERLKVLAAKPDNPFRYTSKLYKEVERRYGYSVELTEAGERARQCSFLKQACDVNGDVHHEGTVRWWLARNCHMGIDKSERHPWLDEPWAKEVKRALKWGDRGYVLHENTSDPDEEATRVHWNNTFQTSAILGPDRLLAERNKWFPRNEPWAALIQEELMVVVLST